MNYIAIFLIAFLLLNKKNSEITDLLKDFSGEELCSLLSLLNIDENLIKLILPIISKVNDGKIDLPFLIKNGLPLLFSYLNSNKKINEDKRDNYNFEIEDFASEEVKQSFKNYFN